MPGNGGAKEKLQKECLITVGATAPFPELIQAALQPECLRAFTEHGYTRLVFQAGDSMELFNSLKPTNSNGLEILGFSFNKSGLGDVIKACKVREGKSEQGLVISHAGAGTILDVMRMGVPLIVVPNTSLLDNHQEELADELVRQKYVTKGDCKGLATAIEKAEKAARKAWGDTNATGSFPAVVDRVVGYEDDIRARLD